MWYRIAGNFQGRNLHEFRYFTATCKSFPHEILGMPHPLCDQFNIPRNAPFLPIHESFLPRKFPTIRYVLVPLDGFQLFKHYSIAFVLLYDMRRERSFFIKRFPSYMLLKALYQDIRAACYYSQKHLKSTAQRDVKRTQAQAVLLAAWHLPRPQLSFDRALHTLWWQVSTEMKTKTWKEKQTDSSAPLSVLTMSILLALSPDRGRSATSAGQARGSGVIAMLQNRNTRSAYTDISIFLAQKNTKNVTKHHGFYFYPLYADTVPLKPVVLYLFLCIKQFNRPLGLIHPPLYSLWLLEWMID